MPRKKPAVTVDAPIAVADHRQDDFASLRAELKALAMRNEESLAKMTRDYEAFQEHLKEQREWDIQRRLQFELRQLDRELRRLEEDLCDCFVGGFEFDGAAFAKKLCQRDKLLLKFHAILPLMDDFFESPESFSPLYMMGDL